MTAEHTHANHHPHTSSHQGSELEWSELLKEWRIDSKWESPRKDLSAGRRDNPTNSVNRD